MSSVPCFPSYSHTSQKHNVAYVVTDFCVFVIMSPFSRYSFFFKDYKYMEKMFLHWAGAAGGSGLGHGSDQECKWKDDYKLRLHCQFFFIFLCKLNCSVVFNKNSKYCLRMPILFSFLILGFLKDFQKSCDLDKNLENLSFYFLT